jgi:hypothetical protein
MPAQRLQVNPHIDDRSGAGLVDVWRLAVRAVRYLRATSHVWAPSASRYEGGSEGLGRAAAVAKVAASM